MQTYLKKSKKIMLDTRHENKAKKNWFYYFLTFQ